MFILVDEKGSEPKKESKSGLPQLSVVHVIIAVAVIILAVVFIAKFGFGMDLISPSSGEMAIVKRPVTPVPTNVQNPAIRPPLSIRPEPIPTCASPTTMCGESCTNTATDQNNCGSCGRVCSVAYSDAKNVAEYGCAVGQCTIQSCQPGFGDCSDKGPLNINGGACETDLKTSQSWIYNQYDTFVYQAKDPSSNVYLENPRNCGSCGNACKGGSSYFGICDNGACRQVCWGPWLNCDNSMNNGCEQVWDNNNCGACGAKCPSGSACNEGCCWKAQYNPSVGQMEQVTVADSLGGTCSGNAWNRMVK